MKICTAVMDFFSKYIIIYFPLLVLCAFFHIFLQITLFSLSVNFYLFLSAVLLLGMGKPRAVC